MGGGEGQGEGGGGRVLQRGGEGEEGEEGERIWRKEKGKGKPRRVGPVQRVVGRKGMGSQVLCRISLAAECCA